MNRFLNGAAALFSIAASIAAIIVAYTQASDQITVLETVISGGGLDPEYQALSSRLFLLALGFGLTIAGIVIVAGTYVLLSEFFGLWSATFFAAKTPVTTKKARLIGYGITTTIAAVFAGIAAYLLIPSFELFFFFALPFLGLIVFAVWSFILDA